MNQSVYLDTTIPSYYHDDRADLQSLIHITKIWWDQERNNYDLYTSEYTIIELSEGEYPEKTEALKFMRNIATLPINEDIVTIAEIYMKEYVMPKGAAGDAFHLACASYNKIDYLLTWNCNHLANANKEKHIHIINAKLNLFTPTIITPIQLFPEKD